MKKVQFFNTLNFPTQAELDSESLHVWILNTSDDPTIQVLSHYLPMISIESEWRIGRGGKPYLRNNPLYFNISHTQSWYDMILSLSSPVGIDIEFVRPIKGIENLLGTYFSKREQNYINQDTIKFFQTWNRKEAGLKTLGLGLQDNLSVWDFLGTKALTEWEWFEPHRLYVQSLPDHFEYTAAIAYLNE